MKRYKPLEVLVGTLGVFGTTVAVGMVCGVLWPEFSRTFYQITFAVFGSLLFTSFACRAINHFTGKKVRGKDLDNIGMIYNIRRYPGESDAEYHTRLQEEIAAR